MTLNTDLSGELVRASTLHRLGLETTNGYVSNLALPNTYSCSGQSFFVPDPAGVNTICGHA